LEAKRNRRRAGTAVALTAAAALSAALLTAAGMAGAGQPPERQGGALAGVHWDKRVKAARRVARSRDGHVAFALRGGGVKRAFEGGDRFSSASVVKAMLLVAYLRRYSDRKLSDAERERLRIMIKRSDNDAATEVRDIVGNGALEKLAEVAGFRCFATSASSWGSTQICPRDMALFMKEIERLLPGRHRGFAMTLLKRIVRKQRWGIPEAIGGTWTPFFKGGWHDDAPDNWRVHQIALVRGPQGEELAVAVLSSGQKSKGYGIDTVTKVARALIGPVTNKGGKGGKG
jgi:hypothetical protein